MNTGFINSTPHESSCCLVSAGRVKGKNDDASTTLKGDMSVLYSQEFKIGELRFISNIIIMKLWQDK